MPRENSPDPSLASAGPFVGMRDTTELRSKTDAELWRALKDDQTAVLGALYDRYASLVYGLALAILTETQDAEDLTQDIFLTLCKKCDYEPARGPLSGFLITLTRSWAIDKLRSGGRSVKFLQRWREVSTPETLAFTPLEKVSLAESSRQARSALALLPDNQRQVLEMAYYKGLSQIEIATQLDTSLGTVKSWTWKGLCSLRLTLQGLVG